MLLKHAYLVLFSLILFGCVTASPLQTPNQDGSLPSAAPLVMQGETADVLTGDASNGRSVEIVGGDEESLREFIQRWLTPVYPGAAGGVTRVTIGSLPEDLPEEVPIPKGARVVAVIQEPESFNQIILDSDLTPEEIKEYYGEALLEKGWRAAPQDPQMSGFVAAGDTGERYCHDQDQSYLEVWAIERPEGPTDLRLTLYPSADSHFCQEPSATYMDQGMSLIPALEAHPGVRLTGGGSGGSSEGNSYVSTSLETSFSVGEILDHYDLILKQAGWEQVDQGLTEVVAWSTWKLNDEQGKPWSGTLIVMESPSHSERRFALLNLEKVP